MMMIMMILWWQYEMMALDAIMWITIKFPSTSSRGEWTKESETAAIIVIIIMKIPIDYGDDDENPHWQWWWWWLSGIFPPWQNPTMVGEMSVMIKVGMCQCQNPTIHDKLQLGPFGSGKLSNTPPVLRHNISAQLGLVAQPTRWSPIVICQSEPQTRKIDYPSKKVNFRGLKSGNRFQFFFRTHKTCWECVFCKKRHLIWSSFA